MNVLIVEDEKKTAELLKELIEDQPDYLVVNICDSVESTVAYLKKHQQKLDLIFLDIQLADSESFEIFDSVEVTTPVIFCTAFDEYVMQAFKSNGVDYILKPFKESDILQALGKIEKLRNSLTKGTLPPEQYKQFGNEKKEFQKSFIVRYREVMFPISVDDIAFILLENEIVHIFNFKGEKFAIFKKLDEIENAVDNKQFFRINRQMIVNRNAIKEIVPYFNRKVIVQLKINIPKKAIVSRLKVTPFISWIEKPE
ncbi:LytR/AlgR family response regulator transcription factor [Chondrinema litorale]|uniref:LytR/AlgR family response regulator transcription factor n=1 Tax=Chondrinema litorale TaxID=2994555 RepID=UPI002543DD27|nr:LytTR family DNA-binding domain-containing protein [Chondrinema litorale]UZR98890.1 LytTR family DNA-binding domain-containing protein [Chondrinema litorale]